MYFILFNVPFSGTCFLPWLPILGVAIAFLVVLSVGLALGLCLCLCHDRNCQPQNPRNIDDSNANSSDELNLIGHSGLRFPLRKDDLDNDRRVLNWLSSVINILDSEIVESRHGLHGVLTDVLEELRTHKEQLLRDPDQRCVSFDDDGTENIEMKELMIEDLIKQLNKLLGT